MSKNQKQQPIIEQSKLAVASILIIPMAAFALLHKGNYHAAFVFYRHSGGGGLNVYKRQANKELQRAFAIDYHPFWDNKTKQSLWKLHYHRGENRSQMQKHRPYQGGW